MNERRRAKARPGKKDRPKGVYWDASQVRALRQHLGLSQQGLAWEMGTRQQTVSEWETGQYQPRGTSERLLSIIAERAAFDYGAEQGGTSESAASPGRKRPSPQSR
ncbi:MAG: helix-turn-helix domain-containing protein [Dehalococcoidia bacterium]